MSLLSLSSHGKDNFTKRGRVPNIGLQHSLDSAGPDMGIRQPGGLSQLSTNPDGSLTRRKALAPLNSAENVTIPIGDPLKKTSKIPGIPGGSLSKTKRHDHDALKSAFDFELPTKDPFTKAAKIPGISGSEHSKIKRHDHDEPKTVLDTGLPTKDPFTKAAKIPGILGSELGKTKRHDHDEPKTVLDTGLPTKDSFTKAAKIPGILGSELGKTKRHDHDEPKTVLDTGLPTKDPFTKAAKIPGILGSELGKTKRHDHDEPKTVLDTELPTKDPFTKAAKIPAILGSELGKTKRHDHDGQASGIDQGQQHSLIAEQSPLQPAGTLRKMSTESDGTLARRKSLAPIESGSDKDVTPGESLQKASMIQRTVGSKTDHKKKQKQKIDIRKELDTSDGGKSGVLNDEEFEAYSYQSTDEEEFYRQHILAQEQLRKHGIQQPQGQIQTQGGQQPQVLKELKKGQDVDQNTAGEISKKTKKKDKKEKEKKKTTPAVWSNLSRGHKFEDLPYFRQIRMRYPEYPHSGLPHWAKYYPTPPGYEKMPIPEMYQDGRTPYEMPVGYENMYGPGGFPHGSYEGMQYGGRAGGLYYQ